MFDDNDDKFIDDKIDTYIVPNNTTLFDKQGTVIFPSFNKAIQIEENNTLVSIFFEKREIDKVIILDGEPMKYIHNFIFLYKFMGIDKDGATVMHSFLDETRAKIQNNYKQTEEIFSKFHHKLSKLSNHRLIYYGRRNEG